MPFFEAARKRRQQQQTEDSNLSFFHSLKGLPFYIWDKQEHIKRYKEAKQEVIDLGETGEYPTCCYNHRLSLPVKYFPRPLFQWQGSVVQQVLDKKKVWIAKSRGNGTSELLVVRLLSWLAASKAQTDTTLQNSQMCLLQGTRQELSLGLLSRIRNLYAKHGIIFPNKESILEFPLTGVRVESFPNTANAINSMRGLPFVSVIMADEYAYQNWIKESMDVIDGYRIKNKDIIIVLFSTVNRADDDFMQLGKPGSGYHPIRLPWQIAYPSIYSDEEIAAIRASSPYTFAREMELDPLQGENTLLSKETVDKIVTDSYSLSDFSKEHGDEFSIAVDGGWGSVNRSAVIVTRWNPRINRIQVMVAKDFERPSITAFVGYVYNLILKCGNGVIDKNKVKCYIDSANPEIYDMLAPMLGQRPNYPELVKKLTKDLGITTRSQLLRKLQLHSFNYGTHGRAALEHLAVICDMGALQIHPQHERLITALRAAQVTDDRWSLDKSNTNLALDQLDSLRAATTRYRIRRSNAATTTTNAEEHDEMLRLLDQLHS